MKKFSIVLLILAAFLPAMAAENTDSIQGIAKAAEEGDPAAQTIVGSWYYRGENFPQSYDKAVQWWLRAQRESYPLASANLARCYLLGHGVEQDSTRAGSLLKLAIKLGSQETLQGVTAEADKGNKWCASVLASIYKDGLGARGQGVKRNPQLYAKYLTIALQDSENPEELSQLALAYLNAGEDEKAYELYSALALLGDPNSEFWAGKMLLEGKGVEMDKTAGMEQLSKAAISDHPMANYYMGRSYAFGDGVEKDDATALKYYRRAAMLGNHYGQYHYARALATGTGTEANYNSALRWFERAAHKGHRLGLQKLVNDTIPGSPFARYCYAVKLIRGGSYDEALAQLKQLEKFSKAQAQTLQGAIYLDSLYSGYNKKKGLKLLESAREGGDPLAKYYLGLESLKDDDPVAAVMFFREAAEKECPQAFAPWASTYIDVESPKEMSEETAQNLLEIYQAAEIFAPMNEEEREHYARLYSGEYPGIAANPEAAKRILVSKDDDLLPAMLKAVKVQK